jgi:hypothetical protein
MLIPGLNENIEVFRSRRVMRVTLLKDKCDNIVREIQGVLRNIHRLEVDIDVLNLDAIASTTKKKREIIEDTVIAELARVTETEIVRLPNRKVRSRRPCRNCSAMLT